MSHSQLQALIDQFAQSADEALEDSLLSLFDWFRNPEIEDELPEDALLFGDIALN